MTGEPSTTPPGGQAAPDPDEAIRLGRRRFFRSFVSDAMRTAASVVGAAGALQRTSAEVAGAILAGTEANATAPAEAAGATSADAAPAVARDASGAPAVAAFRSPFRFEADAVIVLDQRRLPDDLVEVVCRTATDVRVAIVEGVIRGASLVSQVAACAIALAAAGAADSRPYARRAIVNGSVNSLRIAAGSAAPVRRALARMIAVMERRADLFSDGPGLATAMRVEAEAIIREATFDHAALGGHGAGLFAAVPDETEAQAPLRILTLGSVGALAAGQVGSVLAVVNRLVGDGRAVEVIVCETRPSLTGTRLTGWELAAAGVPFELIPDHGAGALIAHGDVDIVLAGADAIATNGDVLAEAGTCALALLAARHGVPFAVVAAGVTVDQENTDGTRFRAEPRSAHEVLGVAGMRFAPVGASARNPGLDVTPADLVGAIVTEQGILTSPYAEGLAAVAAAVGVRGILGQAAVSLSGADGPDGDGGDAGAAATDTPATDTPASDTPASDAPAPVSGAG